MPQRLALFLAIALFPTALAAQQQHFDVMVMLVRAQPGGEAGSANGSAVELEWRRSERLGFAVGLTRVEPDLDAIDASVPLSPLTFLARYRLPFGGPALLPHVGAGLAWVRTGSDGDVEYGDEVAPAVDAGLTWRVARRAGVFLDVKYIPVTLDATTPAGPLEVALDPLLVGAGISMRF
jgi:hypothetical protein